MKFYCLTPCLNYAKFIKETMLSVLNQTVFKDENHKLYYTVCDGGSSDDSISIINQVIIDFPPQKNIKVNYISEPDNTMYDALVKGFKSEEGSSDVYCYINAGDYYSFYAFEIVADIFSNNKQVHFLTGLHSLYNDKGHLIIFHRVFYSPSLLLKGLYNGITLESIQQESTFWDFNMHKLIDYDKLKTFKVAGDYFLWQTFIKHTPLYIVNAYLAGFRFHPNQLSVKSNDVMVAEIKSIMAKPTLFDYLLAHIYRRIIPRLPYEIRKIFIKNTFTYDNKQQKYRLI